VIGSVSQWQAQMAAIEKKRKIKIKTDDDEALTPAHVAAIAEAEAMARDSDDARKAYQDRGITEGPGAFTEPGTPAPEDFARPYLDTGHAARPPRYGPPNVAPLPPAQPGILTPLPASAVPSVVGAGPIAQAMAAHGARVGAFTPPTADGR
jgi:hypothetical protein